MIFAFTECIGLILAPIPMRCKTLRAAVTLQDWQLDPKIMETDGGQALASRSPTSRSRKRVSLHHFLMQWSFIWWIGFIPDCPLNLSQNFSLSLIMLFWLRISEFQIWMVWFQCKTRTSLAQWGDELKHFHLHSLCSWKQMEEIIYIHQASLQKCSPGGRYHSHARSPWCLLPKFSRGCYDGISRSRRQNISFYTI